MAFLFSAMQERIRGRKRQEINARIMRRDNGLCQPCLKRGVLTPAAEVDHIVALTNGGTESDDNKQAICIDCHKQKTRADKGFKPINSCGADGIPQSSSHHWNR